MEQDILAAIKAGEVVATEAGREAALAGMQWHNWKTSAAVACGYLDETNNTKAARLVEFTELIGLERKTEKKPAEVEEPEVK